MQFQHFRGIDVKEALSRVRAELGPDALIASTRHVRDGALGSNYVEIEAAPPSGQGPFSYESTPRSSGGVTRSTARSVAPSPPSAKAQAPAPARADLEREVNALRSAVEELRAACTPRSRVLGRLHAIGVEGALAAQLAAGAPKNPRKGATHGTWLRNRVEERLLVSPGIIERPERQLIACVGPTGAGKTTTLAKLAARARLDLGRSVGVVSLDSYRVGAAEQWQRYARLIGLTFHLARDAEDFEHAVSSLETDIVLVDTAGHSAGVSSQESLRRGLENVTDLDIEVLLVLPAWLRGTDVDHVVQTYGAPGPTGIVATKLDEAQRVGGLLHASLPAKVPFAYLCNGPRVPEDIADATVDGLINRFLPDEIQ